MVKYGRVVFSMFEPQQRGQGVSSKERRCRKDNYKTSRQEEKSAYVWLLNNLLVKRVFIV